MFFKPVLWFVTNILTPASWILQLTATIFIWPVRELRTVKKPLNLDTEPITKNPPHTTETVFKLINLNA